MAALVALVTVVDRTDVYIFVTHVENRLFAPVQDDDARLCTSKAVNTWFCSNIKKLSLRRIVGRFSPGGTNLPFVAATFWGVASDPISPLERLAPPCPRRI